MVVFGDMKAYKIEKGIKIPSVSYRTGTMKVSPIAATLNALKKGNSFLVKDPAELMRAEKVMRDMMARERKHDGTRKFTARRLNGSVRIWRVKRIQLHATLRKMRVFDVGEFTFVRSQPRACPCRR